MIEVDDGNHRERKCSTQSNNCCLNNRFYYIWILHEKESINFRRTSENITISFASFRSSSCSHPVLHQFPLQQFIFDFRWNWIRKCHFIVHFYNINLCIDVILAPSHIQNIKMYASQRDPWGSVVATISHHANHVYQRWMALNVVQKHRLTNTATAIFSRSKTFSHKVHVNNTHTHTRECVPGCCISKTLPGMHALCVRSNTKKKWHIVSGAYRDRYRSHNFSVSLQNDGTKTLAIWQWMSMARR